MIPAVVVFLYVIAVIGGGTTLRAVSGGLVPFWLGGAVVSAVVMCYVLFGGMRGTAWVNAFQTVLFLSFGAIAVAVIAAGMGRFRQAVEAMLAAPSTARRLEHFRRTVVLYPICMLAIWLPSVFLGVIANQAVDVPAIAAKIDARATLAAEGQTLPASAVTSSAPPPRATMSSSPSSRDMLRCG